ncbi:MAG: hypothetical protein ACREIS_09600 [Nitrospiraceae bacterium]
MGTVAVLPVAGESQDKQTSEGTRRGKQSQSSHPIEEAGRTLKRSAEHVAKEIPKATKAVADLFNNAMPIQPEKESVKDKEKQKK